MMYPYARDVHSFVLGAKLLAALIVSAFVLSVRIVIMSCVRSVEKQMIIGVKQIIEAREALVSFVDVIVESYQQYTYNNGTNIGSIWP